MIWFIGWAILSLGSLIVLYCACVIAGRRKGQGNDAATEISQEKMASSVRPATDAGTSSAV